MVFKKEDHPAIFMPGYLKLAVEYPITGRKGDDIYALCCAGSGAERETDRPADLCNTKILELSSS